MPVSARSPKLFAGQRVRRLREQHGMSQAMLASRVGVSASYFNQIEQDQRPLTHPLVERLCSLFDIEPSYLGDDELHLAGALREAMADPLFGMAPLDPSEVQALVRASPGMAQRFMTLYRHHLEREEQFDTIAAADRPAAFASHFPYDEVRDWVQSHHNYFDVLDRAAETTALREGFDRLTLRGDLTRVLRDRYGISIHEEPGLLQQGLMWRMDAATGRLSLAEGASGESQTFWMAHNLGLIEAKKIIDRLVREARLSTDEARTLARVSLGNYYAGALMMPYERFLLAAAEMRYDIQRLQARFAVSFEQVCHRLSTMQRPGAPGVPFYFVKTDIAGNVLKRSSATRFQFAHFGGPCPLWNVYRSFGQPGQISVQMARTPDGVTYLNIARTVGRSGGFYLSRPRAVAVVLGCEIQYASQLVYADGLDLANLEIADPIGPGCRVCSRTACRHRAVPPLGRALDIGTDERGVVPYRISD